METEQEMIERAIKEAEHFKLNKVFIAIILALVFGLVFLTWFLVKKLI